MNDVEFRAVLDWWMCSDPWPELVPKTVIDDWLERESQHRGYESTVVAFHEHNVDCDPAPYCSHGHMTKASCDCGPIADSE